MTTPPTALELRDVALGYDAGPTLLEQINLTLAAGETIALVGASGSGKSTLLRGIAGLEPLRAGEVWMGGRNVTALPPHRRGCGMVFQDGQLFAHRTVARNIAYGLEVQRMPRPERDARVASLLELVGLAGFGDRAVTQLSGGQAQRVALARALAPRPSVLLLDEPFSALDTELRQRLALEVRDILREHGTAAVHVTHDRDEARTIGMLVLEIRGGRLELST